MRTVIISPHPDDEWLGCGCLILKKSDEGEALKVLQITLESRNTRAAVSKQLAEDYNYELKVLGESEINIDRERLVQFLKKEINEDDEVYIPDQDVHPDHRMITQTCREVLKNNKFIQYCVYNNSRNPYIRLRNKLFSLLWKKGFPSFRLGKEDKKFAYKLHIKKKNIMKYVVEIPRDADVFREVKPVKKENPS